SEQETREHLDRILSDGDYWMRKSVEGIRCVYRNHAYAHRIREIFGAAGVDYPESPGSPVATLSACRSDAEIAALRARLDGQTRKPEFAIVLPGRGVTAEARQRLHDSTTRSGIRLFCQEDGRLERLAASLRALGDAYVAVIKPNDYYGRHYIEDVRHAAVYSR